MQLLKFHPVLGYGIQTSRNLRKVAKRKRTECKLAWKELSKCELNMKNKQQNGEVVPLVHSCGHYFTYSLSVRARESWLLWRIPGIGDVARATRAGSRQLSDCWVSVLLRQGVWGGEWVRMNEKRVPISPRSLDLPASPFWHEILVRWWFTYYSARWRRSGSTLRDTVRTCAVPKSNSTPSEQWVREVLGHSSFFVFSAVIYNTVAPKVFGHLRYTLMWDYIKYQTK